MITDTIITSIKTTTNTDSDTCLLFFHGLDSSDDTTKYTCITHRPKYCQTVNYRQDLTDIFGHYESLIKDALQQYNKVRLAGHSLGGWFANYFAHQYSLPALLIAPCINPSDVLADRIAVAGKMTLPFPTHNSEPMRVMIEVDDENLAVATARQTLVDLPKNWQVDYFDNGHHRIARVAEINQHIDFLVNNC